MARPRSPEGKHVTMSARFTEAEAAAIDASLAGLTRSEWLRRQGLAGMRRTQEAVRAQLAVKPFTPEQLQELNDKIAADEAESRANCMHKGLRMAKGVCPDCQTYVASKS